MSEPSPLRSYRATINLSVCQNGYTVMIDDTEDRWQPWITAGYLVAVSPPVGYEPPPEPFTRENPPTVFDDLPPGVGQLLGGGE